mmetsp:Transcript_40906/g.65864  ORF Transcript_40906/g.65864 Transcript_40906/m.65864 type:complete len:80 (+) Transcript_40906:1-240(+)
MFALLNGVKTCAKHASDNTTCLQFFYHNGVTPQPAWRGVAYSHVPFASTVGTALGHTDAAGHFPSYLKAEKDAAKVGGV